MLQVSISPLIVSIAMYNVTFPAVKSFTTIHITIHQKVLKEKGKGECKCTLVVQAIMLLYTQKSSDLTTLNAPLALSMEINFIPGACLVSRN